MSEISYDELENFQINWHKLKKVGHQLTEVIQENVNKGIFDNNLAQELEKLKQKLESNNFRVAVIGEFNRGKSTLLNALLGEEIQPVSELPCSGVVTVLRYGEQKRVICLYKDGREETIFIKNIEEYKEKVSISEEVAMGCDSAIGEEFKNTEIQEIIFEHPDLEFCRNGVEIIDSPGLNEHPSQTQITEQLIKNTDAVIFLLSAIQILTQWEREFLQNLKNQLNGGKTDKPADNLFVVVNCMDLLKDGYKVQERTKNFVKGNNPLVEGENRIHFISAQEALQAILTSSENDFLVSFKKFTRSLENFLVSDRGRLKFNNAFDKADSLIKKA